MHSPQGILLRNTNGRAVPRLKFHQQGILTSDIDLLNSQNVSSIVSQNQPESDKSTVIQNTCSGEQRMSTCVLPNENVHEGIKINVACNFL